MKFDEIWWNYEIFQAISHVINCRRRNCFKRIAYASNKNSISLWEEKSLSGTKRVSTKPEIRAYQFLLYHSRLEEQLLRLLIDQVLEIILVSLSVSRLFCRFIQLNKNLTDEWITLQIELLTVAKIDVKIFSS